MSVGEGSSGEYSRRRRSTVPRSKSCCCEYQGQKGTLIPLLQGTQAIYGYVPREAMTRIAEFLGEPLSSVFGVATFYAQFRLVPRGKNVIRVCHGTACHVSGAPLVSQEVERHLGIKDGENTRTCCSPSRAWPAWEPAAWRRS